jgi:hypothetical protein
MLPGYGAEVAGAVEIGPVLCEPVRAPDGASLQALNDYYALKKRWNEQQRHG